MKTTKLLHMPSGFIGYFSLKGTDSTSIDMNGARLVAPHNEFKPLSEFNKGDLRDEDRIISQLVPEGFLYNSVTNNPNWNHIKSVTRNNEVIWSREEKSEAQQIIDELLDISESLKGSTYNELIKLMVRLKAIEAKRGAE